LIKACSWRDVIDDGGNFPAPCRICWASKTKPNIHILNIIRPAYAYEALALDVPFAFQA
jgi:hypothetical protein